MRTVIEIPLFPLRSVLCPGVALPLHIFEERYKLMINRCLEEERPFGVLLSAGGQVLGAPDPRVTSRQVFPVLAHR